METNTKYFGTLSYTEEEVITFENGIFGFEDKKRYLLIRFEKENAGILCLQNLEDAQLAFIVANPFAFLPKYAPKLVAADLQKLGNPSVETLAFYTTCVLADDMANSYTNLRCPLVINGDTKQAIQVILEDSSYSFKQPFHEFANKGE